MKSYLNTDFKVTDMRIIANIRCEGLQVFGRPWPKSKVHYVKFVILM